MAASSPPGYRLLSDFPTHSRNAASLSCRSLSAQPVTGVPTCVMRALGFKKKNNRRGFGWAGSKPSVDNLHFFACARPWTVRTTRARAGILDGRHERDLEFDGEGFEGQFSFPDALSRKESLFLRDSTALEMADDGVNENFASGMCSCQMCGRRELLTSLGGVFVGSINTQKASASNFESSDYNMIREGMHPARPAWYEEFYAQSMARTMVSYEAELADYKRQLFQILDERAEQILDLGIGTGPNLKYFEKIAHLQKVVGVDPNLQMAKYCTKAATDAGLTNFEFLQAVGEGIPLRNESMDAVVCTLVLCSVTDVSLTLQEVKRVLKPGGVFLFVEHVPAPEGTGLRFWQSLLDPLQQWVADGCHLTRNTLRYIEEAQFGSLQFDRFSVESVSLIGPHVLGAAYK